MAIATLAGASSSCKGSSRCWEDGSCPETNDAGAQSEATSTFGTSSGDTTSDVGASASTLGVDAGDGTSATTSGTPSSVGPVSSSEDSGTNTGVTTPEPSTSSGPEPSCTRDEHCNGLLCVGGECQVCDPSDHRGCDSSEQVPRCRASEEGNTCVTCIPGDVAPTSAEKCGVNGRGTPRIECVSHTWQTAACDDPDVCEDESTQVGDTPCGPNGEGRYLAKCVSGQWADDTTSCIDDDQCVNGALRRSQSECGFSGYLEQQCVNGVWLTQSNRCLECSRPYYLPDQSFAYALEGKLNVPANPVDPDRVKYYESLNLAFSSIQDLTGIQCFTLLQELDLGVNAISDLTPLAQLTNLRMLGLTRNSLSDPKSLAPLSGLTQLTSLTINQSSVTSLEGLQTLTRLESLKADYNWITDVSPLLPLTALQSLVIFGNPDIDCKSDAYLTLQRRIPDFVGDCE